MMVTQALQNQLDGWIRVASATGSVHKLIGLGSHRNPVDVIAHQGIALDDKEGNPEVHARNEERTIADQSEHSERQYRDGKSP
jgi:hypothetical protein